MRFKDIKLVIFDVDGTLVNSSEYFFQAYEYTLKTHKLPPKTRDELATVIAVAKSLPEGYTFLTKTEAKPEYEATHRTFWLENLHLIMPYKNTVPVLRALRTKGIKIALLTNRKSFMQETLERVSFIVKKSTLLR